MIKLLFLLLIMAACTPVNAAVEYSKTDEFSESVIYKTVGEHELQLYILYPDNEKTDNPAIVFFNGGGWKDPGITQFLEHSKYYAKKGFVCICAEYRVTNVHGSTPFQSLEDAKSAMRYIRKNCSQLRIDPNKIAGSGGSAGGHLAAACAYVEGYNASTDDTNVSPRPNLLILFNPVIDNGPAGYGYDRIGEEYRFFSPLHNLKEPIVPTLFQVGDHDALIPVETSNYYKRACERLNGRCDLIIYPFAEHGFFNYSEYYLETIKQCDLFLKSVEWME